MRPHLFNNIEALEGITISSKGEKSDAEFHEKQMGLDQNAEVMQTVQIEMMKEELLEAQAQAAEAINDNEFACNAYRALLERFPESVRQFLWKEKFRVLSENSKQ